MYTVDFCTTKFIKHINYGIGNDKIAWSRWINMPVGNIYKARGIKN